jgi:hypothetical protein
MQLQEIPRLAERMGRLMCVTGEFDPGTCEDVTGEHEHESADRTEENPYDIVERELLKAKEEEKDIQWLELEELHIDFFFK